MLGQRFSYLILFAMVLMTDLALLHDFPMISQISSHVFVGYAKCQLIVRDIMNTTYIPYLIIVRFHMCHLLLPIRKF